MRQLRKFSPDEDAPLLLSWHRGDISAFENLVWKYLKRVFNLAYYLTGSHESASAATQGVFVAAFVNINTFSSRFHFSNWLITLTLKEVRDLPVNGESVPKEQSPKETGLNGQLSVMIRQLPPDLAEMLVLCHVRGYPLERLAEVYQLRTDVLAARLFAAHEMLAAQLRKGSTLPGLPAMTGSERVAPHPEIRLLLHAYLDSSLSAADSENIRKHLKSCGSCREALTGLEWIIEHLRELPDMDPPHWLAAAVMQRVRSAPVMQPPQRKTPPAIYLQLGVGLLLLSVIGLSAYLLLHKQDNPPQAVSGREAARKPEVPLRQGPQPDRTVVITTAPAAPFRSQGRPFVPEGRTSLPAVPLPLPAQPAEPSALPVSAAVKAPGTEPVTGETSGKNERRERLPELTPDWGESIPAPVPQQKILRPD